MLTFGFTPAGIVDIPATIKNVSENYNIVHGVGLVPKTFSEKFAANPMKFILPIAAFGIIGIVGYRIVSQ